MRLLSKEEISQISGSKFHLTVNLGTALASLAVGFVMGGPAGLGVAACALVAAQGINQTNELAQNTWEAQMQQRVSSWY